MKSHFQKYLRVIRPPMSAYANPIRITVPGFILKTDPKNDHEMTNKDGLYNVPLGLERETVQHETTIADIVHSSLPLVDRLSTVYFRAPKLHQGLTTKAELMEAEKLYAFICRVKEGVLTIPEMPETSKARLDECATVHDVAMQYHQIGNHDVKDLNDKVFFKALENFIDGVLMEMWPRE